jgi:hypothetical protein
MVAGVTGCKYKLILLLIVITNRDVCFLVGRNQLLIYDIWGLLVLIVEVIAFMLFGGYHIYPNMRRDHQLKTEGFAL